jgi:hypothetical protein
LSKDIEHDKHWRWTVDMRDLILALGVLADNGAMSGPLPAGVDVNANNKVDLGEVLYLLRQLSGL